MNSLFIKITILLATCPLLVMGQQGRGNYSTLNLTDLTAFESSGIGWTIAGDLSIDPTSTTKPKTKPGTGILVGVPGSPLSTKFKANDLRLFIEFVVAPGSEGAIILPGRQKIRISDSYRQGASNTLTSGYIGQFPTQNVAKAPGLWQTLEVNYDASVSQLPSTARMNTLTLNGITILETVYLPTAKAVGQAEPIIFEVTRGTMGFKKIGYQLLAVGQPLTLNKLNYKVYGDKWDSKVYNKLDHEGSSEFLTQEVTNGMREFHLVYEGEILAKESGDYTFTGIYTGPAMSLEVDGQKVLDTGESTSQETHSGNINLSQGTHKLKLHYSRFPWRKPALGLRVEKSGVRPYDLHALSSLPEPEPKPFISVTPETQPEMVRSFVLLDGEKYKRTHCISVGSPSGWSYTVDLNRGALLQAWRGQFANVSEMWYERGEPQLLFPAGLTVPVSGKSSIAILQNEKAPWPDSSDVNFLGYKIDQQGFPGFRYQIASTEVSDHLSADKNGITRTFRYDGAAAKNLYSLIASGKQITKIQEGLYQVDNRYYVQIDKKKKVVLRQAGDTAELILPIDGTTSYNMFW